MYKDNLNEAIFDTEFQPNNDNHVRGLFIHNQTTYFIGDHELGKLSIVGNDYEISLSVSSSVITIELIILGQITIARIVVHIWLWPKVKEKRNFHWRSESIGENIDSGLFYVDDTAARKCDLSQNSSHQVKENVIVLLEKKISIKKIKHHTSEHWKTN